MSRESSIYESKINYRGTIMLVHVVVANDNHNNRRRRSHSTGIASLAVLRQGNRPHDKADEERKATTRTQACLYRITTMKVLS